MRAYDPAFAALERRITQLEVERGSLDKVIAHQGREIQTLKESLHTATTNVAYMTTQFNAATNAHLKAEEARPALEQKRLDRWNTVCTALARLETTVFGHASELTDQYNCIENLQRDNADLDTRLGSVEKCSWPKAPQENGRD